MQVGYDELLQESQVLTALKNINVDDVSIDFSEVDLNQFRKQEAKARQAVDDNV